MNDELRALLERIANNPKALSRDAAVSDQVDAIQELRALLAAPKCSACNDTGRMHEPGCEPGDCSACIASAALLQCYLVTIEVDYEQPEFIKGFGDQAAAEAFRGELEAYQRAKPVWPSDSAPQDEWVRIEEAREAWMTEHPGGCGASGAERFGIIAVPFVPTEGEYRECNRLKDELADQKALANGAATLLKEYKEDNPSNQPRGEPVAWFDLHALGCVRWKPGLALKPNTPMYVGQPQGEPVTEKHTYLMGYVHPQGKGRTFVIRNGPPTQEDIESIERLTEVRNNLSQVAITTISRIGNSNEQ